MEFSNFESELDFLTNYQLFPKALTHTEIESSASYYWDVHM